MDYTSLVTHTEIVEYEMSKIVFIQYKCYIIMYEYNNNT